MMERNRFTPRGVNIKAAAAYVGLTVEGYRLAVRKGLYPGPMCDPATGKATNRYDLKAIDLAMDRLSGIEPNDISRQSAYEEWTATHDPGEIPTRKTG